MHNMSLFSKFNIIPDVILVFEEKRGPQPCHKLDLGYNLHTQVIKTIFMTKFKKQKQQKFKPSEFDNSRINPFPKFDW